MNPVVTDLSVPRLLPPVGAWALRHGWRCIKHSSAFHPWFLSAAIPDSFAVKHLATSGRNEETLPRSHSCHDRPLLWKAPLVTDTPRVNDKTSPVLYRLLIVLFTCPPHHHQHLPHAVGGSPLSPHATVESDCHTDLRYLQGPSVIAGQPGFHTLSREHQAWAAPPAGWLDDFSLCSQLRNCPEIGFVSRRAAGLSRYQL